MENKCKNCKYYNPLISTSDGVLSYGKCENNLISGEFTNHIKLTKDENWDIDLPQNSSGIFAELDYYGELYIGENFGCIHFNLK